MNFGADLLGHECFFVYNKCPASPDVLVGVRRGTPKKRGLKHGHNPQKGGRRHGHEPKKRGRRHGRWSY